ncbi:NAD(P)-binding protein [Coemansia reversa NRRL 1564]|uniref:NAD(P)-binding protein n=1 Tax=Coemansia reversa (strain ATCC 12441 / NRRL 1564) TaxID=763665 RepID=A0A2G5B909_COERN|nr:NAD(P)-binding protein [Coemansia reversa NRRL 1564]|eukprot:PIA15513.1 NAD(P)-binding protein [Coemansia reversa NRRL 1564]
MWMSNTESFTPAPTSYGRGCIAIVTGASRGLGREITLEFLRRRVSVIGVSRTATDLNNLVGRALSEAQGNAHFFPCVADITTEQGIWAIEATLAHSGKVLIALINNAGGVEPLERDGDEIIPTFDEPENRALASIENASMDAWHALFDINVFAVVKLVQRFIPIMRLTKGHIINITMAKRDEEYSVTSKIGDRTNTQTYHGWSAYLVSKGAINMLTKTLAHEEPNIVTLGISPGFMNTDMYKYVMENGNDVMKKKEYKKLKKLQKNNEELGNISENNSVQHRLFHPSEPAYVIVRLALESSTEMSGGIFTWDAPELKYFYNQHNYGMADDSDFRNKGHGEETILPPENLFGSY